MESKQLEQAAIEAGIAAGYINAHGKQQDIAAATKRELLAAMGWKPGLQSAAVSPVPVVKVFVKGSRLALPVGGEGDFQWQLALESGAVQQGRTSAKMTLALPGGIPAGYHQLTLTQESQSWSCRIIVAPKRCYEPDALLAGKKTLGRLCAALYAALGE